MGDSADSAAAQLVTNNSNKKSTENSGDGTKSAANSANKGKGQATSEPELDTVYVGRFKGQVTNDEILNLFAKRGCTNVMAIWRVPKRNAAFLKFKTNQDAAKALASTKNLTHYGQTLVVDYKRKNQQGGGPGYINNGLAANAKNADKNKQQDLEVVRGMKIIRKLLPQAGQQQQQQGRNGPPAIHQNIKQQQQQQNKGGFAEMKRKNNDNSSNRKLVALLEKSAKLRAGNNRNVNSNNKFGRNAPKLQSLFDKMRNSGRGGVGAKPPLTNLGMFGGGVGGPPRRDGPLTSLDFGGFMGNPGQNIPASMFDARSGYDFVTSQVNLGATRVSNDPQAFLHGNNFAPSLMMGRQPPEPVPAPIVKQGPQPLFPDYYPPADHLRREAPLDQLDNRYRFENHFEDQQHLARATHPFESRDQLPFGARGMQEFDIHKEQERMDDNRSRSRSSSPREKRGRFNEPRVSHRMENYCLMIGERLERMSDHQRSYARLKIEEALYAAEFNVPYVAPLPDVQQQQQEGPGIVAAAAAADKQRSSNGSAAAQGAALERRAMEAASSGSSALHQLMARVQQKSMSAARNNINNSNMSSGVGGNQLGSKTTIDYANSSATNPTAFQPVSAADWLDMISRQKQQQQL